MFPLIRFKIQDESMNPTLKSGDYIIVNKFSRKFRTGNIVVFKHDTKFLVKRIKKISGNKIFVMGDNRSASKDSRKFGTIDKKDVVGKVLFQI